MRRAGYKTVYRVAVLSGVVLLALVVAGTASTAPRRKNVTYIACIELTGDSVTLRDLKLRQGPCHANERRVDWPPTGGTAIKRTIKREKFVTP